MNTTQTADVRFLRRILIGLRILTLVTGTVTQVGLLAM